MTTTFKSTPMMRALAGGLRGDVPTHIEGMPGEGKTKKIKAFGTAWGFDHVGVLVGSVRERSDYLGLPFADDDNCTGYLTPRFAQKLNDAQKGLLVLDEFSCNDDDMMKPNLALAQERMAGDTPLADHVRILALSNPAHVAVGGNDLPVAIANRFMHLDWHFDVDEWMEGMLNDFATQRVYTFDQMLGESTDSKRAAAKGMVLAFLKSASGSAQLRPGPPKDEIQAAHGWASPRSWDNATKVLGELDPHDDAAALLVMKGLVGEGAAIEFFTFREASDLFDPADVIEDPSIVEWHKERPDRLFALTTGIAALAMMRADDKTWTKAMKALTVCAANNRADVALPNVRTLVNNMPAGASVPRATRDAFADLFTRTGQWQTAAA